MASLWGSEFDTDLLVTGVVDEGVQVDGVVDLTCSETHPDKVKGTVRLVLQRGDAPPHGQEFDVSTTHGSDDCAGAEEAVIGKPNGLLLQIRKQVEGLDPSGLEDGDFSTAEEYEVMIKKAEENMSTTPIG